MHVWLVDDSRVGAAFRDSCVDSWQRWPRQCHVRYASTNSSDLDWIERWTLHQDSRTLIEYVKCSLLNKSSGLKPATRSLHRMHYFVFYFFLLFHFFLFFSCISILDALWAHIRRRQVERRARENKSSVAGKKKKPCCSVVRRVCRLHFRPAFQKTYRLVLLNKKKRARVYTRRSSDINKGESWRGLLGRKKDHASKWESSWT